MNVFEIRFIIAFVSLSLISNLPLTKMKRITIVLFAVFCGFAAKAQKYTFSKDVASVVYANCTYCHHEGAIAPPQYRLTGYSDVYALRYTIKSYINSLKMPPWPPDPKYTRLAHERILSQDQINMITSWVDNGADRGDSTKEPALPVYSTNSQLSSIDISKTIPTYTVSTNTDDYRCFAISGAFSAAKILTGVEFKPANGKSVHHILLYYDTTGTCAKLDKADTKPGYASFGGVGSNNAVLIGGWVPGSSAITMPKGMGMTIPKGADLVMQIHYAPGSNGEKDSTSFDMQFSSNTGLREVYQQAALNHMTSMINGPLVIPANTVRSFKEKVSVPFDVSVIGIAPHMHLLGQNIKVYAVDSKGDTLPLIKVNKWDFHWQGFYQFRKVVVLKMGTVVYAEATYDNTTNNPENPNSPPKKVTAGESTTDEMMLVFFGFLAYQKGDENIVLDSSAMSSIVTATQENSEPSPVLNFMDVRPNPAASAVSLSFDLPKAADVKIEIRSLQWQLMLSGTYAMPSGRSDLPISLPQLPAGVYFVTAFSNGNMATKRLVIER
jgi:hypothetical protein